jgi:hypothetical protein
MTVEPHPGLAYVRHDEVAECWEGVGDLWRALDGLPALSEIIDIEESAPQDAIGIHSVAPLWDRFTPEQQAGLNALAAANDPL